MYAAPASSSFFLNKAQILTMMHAPTCVWLAMDEGHYLSAAELWLQAREFAQQVEKGDKYVARTQVGRWVGR